MRKSIIFLMFISGCATNGAYQPHPKIVFTEESTKKPTYSKDYVACDNIAKNLKTSTGTNAVSGAAAGAGIFALTGLILGADVGTLAGLGALHGGVAGAGGSVAYNMQAYKTAFVQCMRDRDYQVY